MWDWERVWALVFDCLQLCLTNACCLTIIKSRIGLPLLSPGMFFNFPIYLDLNSSISRFEILMASFPLQLCGCILDIQQPDHIYGHLKHPTVAWLQFIIFCKSYSYWKKVVLDPHGVCFLPSTLIGLAKQDIKCHMLGKTRGLGSSNEYKKQVQALYKILANWSLRERWER